MQELLSALLCTELCTVTWADQVKYGHNIGTGFSFGFVHSFVWCE